MKYLAILLLLSGCARSTVRHDYQVLVAIQGTLGPLQNQYNLKDKDGNSFMPAEVQASFDGAVIAYKEAVNYHTIYEQSTASRRHKHWLEQEFHVSTEKALLMLDQLQQVRGVRP